MNRITRSTNFSESRLDLRSNFRTRIRPLTGPAAEAKAVPGDRPSLLFQASDQNASFEIGQLLNLIIEMDEPELELSIDARVLDLPAEEDARLIAAYPVRESADLLTLLTHAPEAPDAFLR